MAAAAAAAGGTSSRRAALGLEIRHQSRPDERRPAGLEPVAPTTGVRSLVSGNLGDRGRWAEAAAEVGRASGRTAALEAAFGAQVQGDLALPGYLKRGSPGKEPLPALGFERSSECDRAPCWTLCDCASVAREGPEPRASLPSSA